MKQAKITCPKCGANITIRERLRQSFDARAYDMMDKAFTQLDKAVVNLGGSVKKVRERLKRKK